MPQYILRELPPDLWNRVKARAQQTGWPLRALFLRLLDDFAEGRVKPSVGPPGSMGALATARSVSQAMRDIEDGRRTEDGDALQPGIAVIKLHDGDRTERIPGVAYAREDPKHLLLYGQKDEPLGRIAWSDIKSWMLVPFGPS